MARDDEPPVLLTVEGREVRVTHPSKRYFAAAGLSKLDLVQYYLAVAPGALRGIRDRPVVLKRFVNGAEGEVFYQKRAPATRPAWLRTAVLRFPSGRTAEEVVVDDAAGLTWIANLGCLELHPHAVRAGALDFPDELRVDLDPGPGVGFADVRAVALEVRAVLEAHGLSGFPKTSGSRGLHILVRVEPRWGFDEVRRAALALAREVERRVPTLATSKWWKEERHGVFLDYNQNAKDRTTCSAYSVRPLPDARVSAPLRWDEVAACEPADFTVRTMPGRWRRSSSWPRATRPEGWAMRRGRRTSRAGKARPSGWLPRGPRRPSARRCRSSSSRGLRRRSSPSRAWSAGRRGTPRPPPTWRWKTYWWTPCAGAPRRGPAFG
jgi:bifunctional non-homologous end joining protein LigD